MSDRLVPSGLAAGQLAQFRAVPQRFAVGAELAQDVRRSRTVLPGPGRRDRVPARRTQQDEEVLRARGHVQRTEDGVRVLGPARHGRSAGRCNLGIPAVRG